MVYGEVIPFARAQLQSLNTTSIEHIYIYICSIYIYRLMLRVNKLKIQVVSLVSSVYLNVNVCVRTTPNIVVYTRLCDYVCVRERITPTQGFSTSLHTSPLNLNEGKTILITQRFTYLNFCC
jgi:hypothetical protein